MYCASASEACFVLLVENMVELTKPFAPENVLHCTLMAKNIG